MRKLLLTTLVLVFALASALAQPADRVKERVKAQRVAIYTEVLNLTSEEAEGFWPIYNQFLKDREKVQSDLKDIRRDNLTDAEAEAQVKKYLELRQRELDLEKEMVQKVRKVISMQKIGKIPEAEREFRKIVLEKLKDRAEERKGKRGG